MVSPVSPRDRHIYQFDMKSQAPPKFEQAMHTNGPVELGLVRHSRWVWT